eukprot:Pgem_evm1s9394
MILILILCKGEIALHCDEVRAHAENKKIVTVSLGGPRAFYLYHNITKEKKRILLEEGSYLMMAGKTQEYWQHCV